MNYVFSEILACCIFLLYICTTGANRPCRLGDKVYSVNRIARNRQNDDFVLLARCRYHIEEECVRSCSWARSCRESQGWWRYGRGERSYVAGIRYDLADNRKLELYCCASLSTNTGEECEWATDHVLDIDSKQEILDLRTETVSSGINSISDTVIRDVIVSPYEDDGKLKFRTEICTIKRERSTCNLSKLEGSEKRDYRILLLRANRARSQLIRRNDPSVLTETLMDLFFKPKTRPPFFEARSTPTSAPRTPPSKPTTRTSRPLTRSRSRPITRRATTPPKLPPRRTTDKTTTAAPRQTTTETTTKATTKKSTRRTTAERSLRRTTTLGPTTKRRETCPKPGFDPCVSKKEANFRLSWCCQGLEAGCTQLCHYDISEQQLIPVVLSNQCSPQSLAKLIQCASDFKDATLCCQAKGVLAGGRGHCAPFCNPVKGLPGIDLRYLPCVQQLTQISHCFWAGLNP